MVTKRILIIEDDPAFLDILEKTLKMASYQVDTALHGQQGIVQFQKNRPDLVLLDFMLPDINGFDICHHLHKIANVPILFLTAVTDEESEIKGLECGAVDYLTKPISSDILLARVQAKLRHRYVTQRQGTSNFYQDEHLLIDLKRKRVEVRNQPINLTKTEYLLLSFLFLHANRVMTKEQIQYYVWGWQHHDVSNMHVYISRLRKKIEINAKNPQYLRTFRNFGYQFIKPQIDNQHKDKQQNYLEN